MFLSFFPSSLPVEQPDLLGAGQSAAELVFLWCVTGAQILLPGKLPLCLPTVGQSLAVDLRSQVGVDPASNINTKLYYTLVFSELNWFSQSWLSFSHYFYRCLNFNNKMKKEIHLHSFCYSFFFLLLKREKRGEEELFTLTCLIWWSVFFTLETG